jgi:MarR family 2-MHQ and catechol resistance regulon transcriptional repressor
MLSNDVKPTPSGIPGPEADTALGFGATDEVRPEGTPAARAATDDGAERGLDRGALERELLDELTAWSTRDRGGVFKTWHRHALSLVHLNVLTALEAEGPLAMRRLAEAMDVSDASATGIVDRMEKRGLVERRHATGDRRVVLVYQTEAGERVFRDMADRRRDVLAQVLTELTESDMAALLTGLRAIQAARRRVLAGELSPELTAVPETPPTG